MRAMTTSSFTGSADPGIAMFGSGFPVIPHLRFPVPSLLSPLLSSCYFRLSDFAGLFADFASRPPPLQEFTGQKGLKCTWGAFSTMMRKTGAGTCLAAGLYDRAGEPR